VKELRPFKLPSIKEKGDVLLKRGFVFLEHPFVSYLKGEWGKDLWRGSTLLKLSFTVY